MPPPYQPPHWNVFTNIPYQGQGPAGEAPRAFAQRFGLVGVPNVAGLPQHLLDRNSVRAICADNTCHVLHAYVCVMAWGAQGKGLGAERNVTNAWNAFYHNANPLNILRAGGLNRYNGFALFSGQAAIAGLGPSFFTKLLFFFSPRPDFYIMDQWTAKSVNLLTGERVVRVYDSSPTRDNKGGNYQAFCEEVDQMAALLHQTGEQVEERLFSQGGHRPRPWRVHVKATTCYDRTRLQRLYPHIPPDNF